MITNHTAYGGTRPSHYRRPIVLLDGRWVRCHTIELQQHYLDDYFIAEAVGRQIVTGTVCRIDNGSWLDITPPVMTVQPSGRTVLRLERHPLTR